MSQNRPHLRLSCLKKVRYGFMASEFGDLDSERIYYICDKIIHYSELFIYFSYFLQFYATTIFTWVCMNYVEEYMR